MKKLFNEIVGWVKAFGHCLFISGLWVIPIILFFVYLIAMFFGYLIATSNLPDWFKFWLLR